MQIYIYIAGDIFNGKNLGEVVLKVPRTEYIYIMYIYYVYKRWIFLVWRQWGFEVLLGL